MTGLQGKAALVTGGSRGIGRAIVERLAADGAGIVFSYLSKDEAAADVATGIAAAGGTAHAVQADLADVSAAGRLFDRAEELLGPLDILVNNAGTVASDSIADTTDEDFDRSFAVNLKSPFVLIRE